ncbi:MAG: hypothetical protein A2570_01615 [Candidatus Brennerbacteria bacterium RIFOXYD1_FULL_41_16]|uniref:Aspartyl/glutamyl-tRNA(Asn/Gln) amidotransferase subunit C n=1 Tax=Candidatus Brennerbacteria bacterium RIFOXYD1_FULL_41_16 TaxID=1797529 RepID=A0A1G1XLG0_9BACT|nr:MAG: hypothetical protein A2570_01615 [Candidatus Brennerbacteria bacterium RIFOXYD1_FULL_41_16]
MINLEQVRHLAELAHMELSEEELKNLQKDMGGILEFIAQLKEADVSGVEPLTGGHVLENVARIGDSPEDSFAFDKDLLHQFPEKENNYDVVPKIIEK